MSYGGGTVTQPILGGFDDLTKMLLQGSSEIAQINLEIGKRRDNQSAALAEQISKITATGITQHDKLIQQGTRDTVNQLASAFEANKRGEISLSEVSALSAQYNSEASILANMAKLQDQNIQSVNKGVEDGELDSISSDQANALWYNNPGDKKDVYKSPAYNSDGTPKIVNGQQQYVRRSSIEGLQTKRINGVLNVVKIKEVPKRDPKTGDPIVIDGVVQTTNKTFFQPLTEALDPSKKSIRKYDLVKEVKDFQSITGTRVGFVDKNGTYVDNDIAYGGKTAGGDLLSGYTIAPQNFPDMISSIENTIEGTSDDEVISIIHSYMGGKADFQPDYEPPRSKQEVNDDMLMEIVVGGEKSVLPRYYDVNGNVLKFSSDPLDLQTDSKGKISVTEEQRELAKAFKRDKMLKSFNVSYKGYRDHINTANGSKSSPTGISYNKSTYSTIVPEMVDGAATGREVINKNKGLDSGYLKSNLAILLTGKNEFASGADVGSNATRNAKALFNQGKIVAMPGGANNKTLAGDMKLLYERSSNVVGGFNIVTSGGNNKAGGDIISKITQDLKGTTASGGNLKSIGNVIYIDTDIDLENGTAKNPLIVLEGVIDLASTNVASSNIGTTGETSGMSAKETISVNDYYIVNSSTELPSLYKKLWNQGGGPKSFRTILEGENFNSDGIITGGTENEYLEAFRIYTEIINK
jgi:hypothetical protein